MDEAESKLDGIEAAGITEAGLEEAGSGVVVLVAAGLEVSGLEAAGFVGTGSDGTELDKTPDGVEGSALAGDDATKAAEETGVELGTVSAMTTGAEVCTDGTAVVRLDAVGADEDAGEEAGTDSGMTTGNGTELEDAGGVLDSGRTGAADEMEVGAGVEADEGAGVPVIGDPMTEPDESNTTVTGTTTTAVSVLEVMLDDTGLGYDTSTGDSCLEVSTSEAN